MARTGRPRATAARIEWQGGGVAGGVVLIERQALTAARNARDGRCWDCRDQQPVDAVEQPNLRVAHWQDRNRQRPDSIQQNIGDAWICRVNWAFVPDLQRRMPECQR